LSNHGVSIPSHHLLRPHPARTCVCLSIRTSAKNITEKMKKRANNQILYYRGYSAHEHTVLSSNTRVSIPSTAVPQDIIVETLVSLVVVSLGLVLGAEKLKPISWSQWAGEIEKEGGARNPYSRLEERYSFWDVRVSSCPLGLVNLRAGCFRGRWLLNLVTWTGKAEGVP